MNGLRSCMIACVLVLSGCRSHEPVTSQERIERFEIMANRASDFHAQSMSTMRDRAVIGTIYVNIIPENGILMINGGNICPENGKVLLPVGTFEFRAKWDDGQEVVKDIFVSAGESHVVLKAEKQ